VNARLEATRVLNVLETKRTTTRHVWDGARDGATTALVLGTTRRRGTLDAILSTYSSRKLPLIKSTTRAALRAGLFELLYMDDTPVHAVVHATVENVRVLGRPQDHAFANALLRGIRRAGKQVAHEQATDLRRSLPRENFSWLFGRSVFPDRNTKPVEFLAARGSTAKWIAARRLAELGIDRALVCLDCQASTPDTYVRPAPGRVDAVREKLTAAGIDVQDGPHKALLRVAPGVKVGELFEICGDEFVIQDAVASQVAPFLAPQSAGSDLAAGSDLTGWRVLDLCAAPGGKATHLAQLGADVTAWDIDPERLALVAENADRLGLANLKCAEPEGEYDAVLVDAPCSNTGVLARRPEARWRVKERHLKNLVERQRSVLRAGAERVRPGGVLVYSTCSLEIDENRGVADFLVERGGFRLVEDRTCYPDESGGDGGYMARLLREDRSAG